MPSCFQCAVDNGCLDPAQVGGSCEDATGTAPAACSTALGQTTPVSETQVCLATLDAIFASGCSSLGLMTPCLCGTSDAGACLSGSAPANGPVTPIYQCELGLNGPQIANDFTVQTFGAGMGNALVQCAGAFGCGCE
jgi:hypothetical protein